MRIYRGFENWRDWRDLSGKFLRLKSCYPESFRFLWLWGDSLETFSGEAQLKKPPYMFFFHAVDEQLVHLLLTNFLVAILVCVDGSNFLLCQLNCSGQEINKHFYWWGEGWRVQLPENKTRVFRLSWDVSSWSPTWFSGRQFSLKENIIFSNKKWSWLFFGKLPPYY